MIYFDNSATTFPKPESVYDAINYASRYLSFNAGRGTYKEAKRCSEIIMETRKSVGSLINCDWRAVTFFSSATEALNIIINGLDINDGDNIYVSPFEHNAIIRPLYTLQKRVSFNIITIPFDRETWELNVNKFKNQLVLKKPKAVFVSHVSNVTGYILPYEQIFALTKAYNSINVLDSAQAFGILNPSKENVDFIVFAGHKSLYATFGIAGFINLNNTKLLITKSGGNGSDSLNHDMPENYYERYESGSPNMIAIYSLLKSIEWIKQNNLKEHQEKLTKYLIEKLQENQSIKIYIPSDISKIFGIVSINVDGYNPDDVAYILNEEFNICVRSGFHCSPFVHEFIDSIDKSGTVRISIGAFNFTDEIDKLIDALNTLKE